MPDDHGIRWQTPPVDAAHPCPSCPGSWTFDEVYGWMHGLGHQAAGCVPPPTRIPALVIT